MEEQSRIALVAVVVGDLDQSEAVNAVLHEFSGYAVGRMGIPYRERGVSVISLVLDAPTAVVSALTGKLGMLAGVSAKAVYAKQA